MKAIGRLKGSYRKGFTLVELMIVLIVVAILLALAYPSYIQYVREAKRAEAQQRLMNWAVNQEIWRSNNPEYASVGEFAAPQHDDYNFDIVPADPGSTAYTLRAIAKDGNDQNNDVDHGIDCSSLTLDQNGSKTPLECWGGSS